MFTALESRRKWHKILLEEKGRAGVLLGTPNAKKSTWAKANELAFNSVNSYVLWHCFWFNGYNFK